jgi:hypothetical protein
MPHLRTWRVDYVVKGPIEFKYRDDISFDSKKELVIREIFQSDINIKKIDEGFFICVSVSTSDQKDARKIGLLYLPKFNTNFIHYILAPSGFSSVDCSGSLFL